MREPAALDTREIAQSVGRHRLQIEHLPNRARAAGCRSLHAPGNGGSPKGAELIAAKWATNRKVQQIAFKPDWTKHQKAAPFRRNDAMLAVLPIGVMVFPGTGIQGNLADKAKKLGIPVWKVGDEVASAKAGDGA
jgi:YspA, cpYpsA-related SLOG family